MNAILFLALAFAPGEAVSLFCPQPTADYGVTRGGPTIVHKFKFSNRSAADLAIVHVLPSCGCLAPKLSKTKLTPGESATLELSIGTISQPEGDNLWSVQVYYRLDGESENRKVEWHVRAKLVREVSLEPAALRLAGNPGLTYDLTLTDRRAKPLELAGIYSSSDRISAKMEDWKRTETGWVRKIHVRLTKNCPAGTHEDAIQIILRDPDYGEIRVPVTVVRHATKRFLLTPEEAKLELQPGKAASVMILLRDHNGQAVEIEKAECSDPALTCRFASGAFPTAAVKIMAAKGSSPARSSSVRVQIKSPVAQTVVIPVVCPNGK